jgi:predicted RNA-binding protein
MSFVMFGRRGNIHIDDVLGGRQQISGRLTRIHLKPKYKYTQNKSAFLM